MQLGGLGSVLDWRSHQGIRQSKLCNPLRIPPLVKERTLVRPSLTLFYKCNFFKFLHVHILFKIWIQLVAVRLQEEQKETTKENRRPEYTSVFLFAFTYVGINLDYVDLKRILQEAGNKPPREESKLKQF